MNKPLNPSIHGILDYLYAGFLLLAPMMFGFTGTFAATLCYIVGIFHIGLSLMTIYPLGLVKAIPFTVHAGIEFATAIFLILSPWLFGFAEVIGLEAARNTFVLYGIGLTAVWALTDYRGGGTVGKIQPMPKSGVYRKAA